MSKRESQKKVFINMKKSSFDSEEYTDETVEDTECKNNIQEEQSINNLDLIKSISTTLTMILEENQNLKNYKEILQKQTELIFNTNSIPKISIYNYLLRIQKYSNIEKNTLIISLIYIDRLCKISHLTLTYYNIHRIIFISILIAIKYNEDCFYDNNYYSKIAGVNTKELNCLEITFVEMCKFKLFVPFEIFQNYSQYLNSI